MYIQWYKFLLRAALLHCADFKLYFHFHLVHNILKFLLKFLLWPMCRLKMCGLISKYLRILQLSFCYWCLVNSTVVWEQIWYDFYPFRLKAGGERSYRGQDGWMVSPLDGHEFEQAPGDGEGERSLASWSPWGQKVEHNWVTEQQKMEFHGI